VIPTQTIGASFGAAFLAASAVAEVRIGDWNPAKEIREARTETAADYEQLYQIFRELYPATQEISHALAERQRRLS